MRRLAPKLITFDVTDTLLMTKLKQHYVEAASRHGCDGKSLDGDRLAVTFKTTFKRLEKEYPIYGKHTGLGWENWWRKLVHEVFRDQDRGFTKDQLDKVEQKKIFFMLYFYKNIFFFF